MSLRDSISGGTKNLEASYSNDVEKSYVVLCTFVGMYPILRNLLNVYLRANVHDPQ